MIVLASKSPRRRELLSLIIKDFEICESNIDESIDRNPDIYKIPSDLAYRKAKSVLTIFPNATIIGSDTVVIIDNEILEKPKDHADAYRMLKKLSGRTHIVISAICIMNNEKTVCYQEIADVTFYQLSEEIINNYIATSDPYDKAGGYAVQNSEYKLVESIKGEYNTVVGLPLERLKKELTSF